MSATTNHKITLVRTNYQNQQHAQAIVMLLDEYACDPMGGSTPLAEEVKHNLVAELSKVPHAFSLLIYVDETPAALATCFDGFSTFACKPLINIHDLYVAKAYRGMGLSQQLLHEIEAIARQKGCCKITLEVLGNNLVAQSAYKKFGFYDYALNPDTGSALFWQKNIDIN